MPIRQSHDVFLLHRGPKPSLSDHSFVYALCDFWNGIAEAQQTLALSEIGYRKGSPGTVFRLDENTISERLERLETVTEGRLVYAETAGLRQVYRNANITLDEMLQAHYAAAGDLVWRTYPNVIRFSSDWRQLEIPLALTRLFCYRRGVVAS